METTPTTTPHIPIIFENKTGLPDSQVWVQFLNGSFGPDQSGANGRVALQGDTAYSFEALSSTLPDHLHLGKVPNVSLSSFTNGRIYFNFGSQGLQGLGNGYQPASNTPADANYHTQYAYVELNVFGTAANNMDISAIDFLSIPIEASTWKNGQKVNSLTCKSGGEMGDVIEKLIALSHNEAAVYSHQGFVRVNAPGLSKGYHNWDAYLCYLSTLSYSTLLKGNYAGMPSGSGSTAAQTYTVNTKFNVQSSQGKTTGTVHLKGQLGVIGKVQISIDLEQLNAPTGIYGANPSYTVTAGDNAPYTTNGIVNDVYGWIVGDLLTGLNLGFPGSETKNPQTLIPLGQCSSEEWFAAAQKNPALQFAGAQPNNPDYYNNWAAAIVPAIDGYGFPFSDRVENLLLYFPSGCSNAVDYLKITLNNILFLI